MKNRMAESYILKCEEVIFMKNEKYAETLLKDILEAFPKIDIIHDENPVNSLRYIKQQLMLGVVHSHIKFSVP